MKTKIFFLISFVILSLGLFAQTSYNMNQVNGQTLSGCNFMLYDSGGPSGSYGNSEDYTVTFCSPTPGVHLDIQIQSWACESATFDHMTIYNNSSASGATLVSNMGGTQSVPINYTTTGDCVTFVWHTDGSVTYGGFAIHISCAIPCQPFTFTINGIADGDTTFLDMCQTTSLIAIGNYPNNNTDYLQTDENITWHWDISHEGGHQFINGVGNNEVLPNYTNGGGYLVTVIGTDINGCTFTHTPIRLRVALKPTFSGTAPDNVCPGEPFILAGAACDGSGGSGGSGGSDDSEINFEVEPWAYSEPEVLFETHCFLDNLQGQPQTANFTYTSFNPACVISSVSDIVSIVIYMEHSYIGDLSMYVTCPNGSQVNLIQYGSQSCGSAYLGYPIDDYCGLCDSGCAIDPNTGIPINGGQVLPYTWAPNGTMTLNQACSGLYSNTVPNSTVLLPTNGFSPFIGCPLNGTWSVSIVDNLMADDGYVNQFEIHFNQAIIDNCQQSNTWNIDPIYTGCNWTGPSIISQSNGSATAFSTVSGQIPYTYTIIDDFNCPHDTTVIVTVLPINDPSCCQFPTPYAGADQQVCGNTFTFNGNIDNGTQCNWVCGSRPDGAPLPTITNPTTPNALVNIGNFYGTYTFGFVVINGQPSCTTTDSITITFVKPPTSTFSTTPINCYGQSTTVAYSGNMVAADGAIVTWYWGDGVANNISADGSIYGPYTVTWGTAGIHNISLQINNNGCTSILTAVNVLMPSILNVLTSKTEVTCFNACNGSATAITVGGTAPYNYSWASGLAINPNLCADSYELTVTDANGCTANTSFIITQPEILEITNTSYENLTCYNNHSGHIEISLQGGTMPYQYHWNDGSNSLNRVSLIAGHYFITINDANGCAVTENFIITQPDELITAINNDMIICQGTQVVIQSQTSGGTLPYQHYWSETPNPEEFSENGQSLTERPDTTTTYRVYVVDAHGCTSNTAIMILTVSPDMVIDNLILTDNSCYHSCNGEAQALFHGGFPPYHYSWGSNTNIFSDLCMGQYSLTITDAVGCYETASFIINEPTELVYSTYNQPTTCFGSNDGIARIDVQNGTGTPSYQYLWPDGQTTNSITTIAGIYEVTVLDANQCRITSEITVSQPTELYTIDIPNTTICYNQSYTLITQTTGGTPFGTQHYNYHWVDNFGNEYFDNAWTVHPDTTTTYYLTVTDSKGCTYSPAPTVIIVNPPLEIVSVLTNSPLICPGQDAEIRVTVRGGNGGPYMMRLQDGTIVGSPFIVNPNETTFYTISVDDMCGDLPVQDTITINVNPAPTWDFTVDVVHGCPPLTVEFTDQTQDTFDQYIWRFGDNN
ncbi:MAG: SprB repeat-containing protein, partial [Bacteroidales bacterium]|nr:SprB repeat-containing protein [Bacteroidales bacterium]